MIDSSITGERFRVVILAPRYSDLLLVRIALVKILGAATHTSIRFQPNIL